MSDIDVENAKGEYVAFTDADCRGFYNLNSAGMGNST